MLEEQFYAGIEPEILRRLKGDCPPSLTSYFILTSMNYSETQQ
jgi:hypothetical protein